MAKKLERKAVRGRPRKAIPPEVVERLASLGLTTEEIAWVYNMSWRTFMRRYGNEHRRGRARLRRTAVVEAVRAARRGDVHAWIWLAHCLSVPGHFTVPLWRRRPPRTLDELETYDRWLDFLIAATKPPDKRKRPVFVQ
jgi:hypothetical protein